MLDSHSIKSSSDFNRTVAEYDRLLEGIENSCAVDLNNASAKLNRLIESITERIDSTDLAPLNKKPNLWARMSGTHLKKQIEIEVEIDWMEDRFRHAKDAFLQVEQKQKLTLIDIIKLKTALHEFSELESWLGDRMHGFGEPEDENQVWQLSRLEQRMSNLKATQVSTHLFVQHLQMMSRVYEFQCDIFHNLAQQLYPNWIMHLQLLADYDNQDAGPAFTMGDITKLNNEIAALLQETVILREQDNDKST